MNTPSQSPLENPQTVKTTCPYCGVGCGVLATVQSDGKVAIAGDPNHPANKGKLCVKGSALGETVGLNQRILSPLIQNQPASWDDALNLVSEKFKNIIEKYGSDAVAMYISGQLLTEDYYVANKLAKGFWGTANIDTNSRLCMSSAVVGHKRAFGADSVPISYEDLDEADLIVLVGSNTAWCHPIIYQRIIKNQQTRGCKLVVIDPRATATTDSADVHIPLKSGTDVHLFNGLLAYLEEHGIVDTDFVQNHTENSLSALKWAAQEAGSLGHIAKACSVTADSIREFYQLFARTPKVVTIFSQGVNQSSSGVDKVNSIINCHLLTGRIGKVGAGPFSITGQPNAMGGREVGGLATMLAAHLDIPNESHRDLVQNFWKSPKLPTQNGLKAVDLFEAIEAGKIKAVWIMATNPVVSLPNADQVKRALEQCELVVVSDMQQTDTAAFADVFLPAAGWGEKNGTVTNSDRTMSRQRPFLPLPGEAKPDWQIICEVAKRMGFGAAFDFQSAHEIFLEHAELSGIQNNVDQIFRAFNISGLENISSENYDNFEPIAWPIFKSNINNPNINNKKRLFEDRIFYTPSRKAQFVSVKAKLPANLPDDDYPLILNTGRVRDQWHTMTRTGKSARLAAHIPEPFVAINPYDALLCGVKDGALARVRSAWGACVVRVKISGEQVRRSVFVPIHWNDQTASDARIGKVVNPVVDPLSGEPEFKNTPCIVEPFGVNWHGFILSRHELPLGQIAELAYWVKIQGEQFIRYEIAGRLGKNWDAKQWSAWGHQVLGINAGDDWLEYADISANLYRGGLVGEDNRLAACVFVSPTADYLPARAWLSGLFIQDELNDLDRIGLLVGTPADPAADTGATVCACFGVGKNTITKAIQSGCNTAEKLGEKLKCGTNCGSCIPELKRLIVATERPPE